MVNLYFKIWLENQGGGLEPPKESPIDPDPSPGQTCAFPDYNPKELPPVPKKKMKKK